MITLQQFEVIWQCREIILWLYFRYYIMILHGEYSGGAFVQVGVKMFTSPVSNEMCGSAEQEKQTVKISSTVDKEVQVSKRSPKHK
jgi:hypothetical protein